MILSGYNLIELDSIDSTQKELHRLIINKKACHGDVITAKHQYDAIGRHNRKWISCTGNLSLSIAINIEPSTNISDLSFVTAIAAGNAILSLTPDIPLKYKWVNDIMVKEEKLGGILCQYYEPYMIIGLGINISSSPTIPEKKTTFLKKHAPYISDSLILHAFLDQFISEYNHWHANGIYNTLQTWKKRSHIIGENISIKVGDIVYNGSYKDITEDGSIILEETFGKTRIINCGEII